MKPLPRIHIAHLPTPIEPLPRLSEYLGGPSIFIKRDDQTGLAFGGNKVRKLEFLVAEALANGAQTLVTAGAVQSNHCRQTAAAAAHFGLGCILVLAGEQPEHASGNLLLDNILGASVHWTDRSHRDQALQEVFDEAWSEGKRPYMVPYGGSSPIGAAGYASAMQELHAQTGQTPLHDAPDWIVFPSSSGGTQAGMVVGAAIVNFPGKILGISVDQPAQLLTNLVSDLAIQTADRLRFNLNIDASQILVDDTLIGPGYGVLGAGEVEAVRLFARLEGLLLDPVYTGRAAAGLINLARKGFFNKGEEVLFWHTGGSPALFADRYRDLAELP